MRARESFVRNIERCRVLLQIHRKNWPRRPARQGDDLLRAVIVLAVSALDSYLHDIAIENAPGVLLAFAKGKTNAPGKLIEASKPSLTPENCLKLIGRGRPDVEIRKLVTRHVKERTFQDPGEIERALRLIALEDFWEALRIRLRLARKSHNKGTARRVCRTQAQDCPRSRRLQDQESSREASADQATLCRGLRD